MPHRPYHRALTALVLAAAAALGLAGCASYDDHVKDCMAAVKAREDGDTSKPEACKEVKEDDYTTIVMHQVLVDEGLDDLKEHPEDLLDYSEDGDVDRKQ